MTARKDTSRRSDTSALRRQRTATFDELQRLQQALEQSEVDPSVDEADPDVVEREKLLALMEALELRLEEIDAALQRTESGVYGVCERCGKPIDPERLRLMPEATTCVPCKVLVEQERALHRTANQSALDEA